MMLLPYHFGARVYDALYNTILQENNFESGVFAKFEKHTEVMKYIGLELNLNTHFMKCLRGYIPFSFNAYTNFNSEFTPQSTMRTESSHLDYYGRLTEDQCVSDYMMQLDNMALDREIFQRNTNNSSKILSF